MNKHCTLMLDMPMQTYLEHTNYLGGSMLNLILNRPDIFKRRYIEGHKECSTDATKIGSLTHTLFMEPDKVEQEYHLIPPTYVNKQGKTSDWKDNKTYSHVQEDIRKAGNKTRITYAQLLEAQEYANAFLSNQFAKDALDKSVVEPTLFCHLQNEIYLKSRPDLMNTDDDICYNPKTTKSAKPEDFFKTAIAFGYDISAALTAYSYECIYKRPMNDYVFIVVEKSDTKPISIFSSNKPMYGEGSMTFLQFGSLRLKKALQKYKKCKELDDWPAFENDEIMRVPYHLMKEYLGDE